MKVKMKKLNPNAIMPLHGSEKSAGYDLYACIEKERIEIKPHETIKIGTGLSFSIPDGYFCAIYARSGLATNQGLRPANCVGVIDSDYRGEYIIPLHNDTNESKFITSGERIAQLVVMPYLAIEIEEVEELDKTERSIGGFGSTGK